MSGKITEIAGGSIITQTQGDLSMRVTDGSLSLHAGEKTVQHGKENGITYGLYTPEELPPAPALEKVEFLDENDRVLDQSVDDFFYGQKLKIRVTTQDAGGKPIRIALKGETKSAAQPFAFMATARYQWSGVVANDNTFTTPFLSLLPLWYSDDFENYNDSAHKTEIGAADLNAFFVSVTLGAQTAELPAAGARLKPRTYKRNYEELVGLFKTGSDTVKDLSDNYENKFIKKYDQQGLDIKDVTAAFSNWLYRDHPGAAATAIEKEATKAAVDLWAYAVLQNHNHTLTTTLKDKKTGKTKKTATKVAAIADDRPLYWARIAISVMLKRQYVFIEDIKKNHAGKLTEFLEDSVVPTGSMLWNLLQIFEGKSRNYSGIDFSKAAGKKKVLLTGFDPFQLEPTANGVDGPETHNPSGALALALHTLNLTNAYVQTCIFPVRYEDFDRECVEAVMRRFMPEADVVITTSLNGSNPVFDIEGNAIAYRGGFADNMGLETGHPRFLPNPSSQHNLTTLPKTKIFGAGNPVIQIEGEKVRFDESKLTDPTEGAGSNYLSNEIMFRATTVRGSSGKPVGHFHLGNLGGLGTLPKVIRISKEVINRICS